LLTLSKDGTDRHCYTDSNFVGALACADDIILHLQLLLLAVCEGYMHENIAFIVMPLKLRRTLFERLDNTVFYMDNKPISFAKSFTHLGHISLLRN
jgi:hypothetical protein